MASKSIGATIRIIRRARGESQAEVAKRAGIHRITLTHIENGDSKPDFDTVERLAKALRTPMARLLAA
jgi:transcriptional regulator with XRE-family HTH domain